jgi:hypothetical protein
MNQQELASKLSDYRLPRMATQVRFFIILFGVLGLIMIIGGFLGVHSQRVYQIYLVNFAFWTGIAQAGVMFAAVYRMTNGGWSDQFRRIGETFVAFLPISLLLLFVVLIVQPHLYPWVNNPLPNKTGWLNVPFFTLRILFYFTVMTIFSLYYVSISIRPDIGLLKENGRYDESMQSGLTARVIDRLTRNWKGYDDEYRQSYQKLKVLTPIFLILYGVIYTFVGFDLLMTLSPNWYSTLYGWLYIVSGFYSGVVALMIAGYFIRRTTLFGELLDTSQFHDIGKLMLGFCMFTGGLVFSQYLTIWYGNIPKETTYIITRFHQEPWALISTLVLLLAYFVPLVFLFSKKIKQSPTALLVLGIFILIALWLNRFIEVVPSIWHEMSIPLGLVEVGITFGFLAVALWCWLWLARIVPLVPAKPE